MRNYISRCDVMLGYWGLLEDLFIRYTVKIPSAEQTERKLN